MSNITIESPEVTGLFEDVLKDSLGSIALGELTLDVTDDELEELLDEPTGKLTSEQQSLVEKNKNFVYWLASKHSGKSAMTRADLAQEGMLAMCEAALKFEPKRGVPFLSYAGVCIRGRMLYALRDKDQIMKPARRDNAFARDYDQAEVELIDSGDPLTEMNIAQKSGLSPQKVRELRQAKSTRVTTSIDIPFEDGTITLAESTQDPGPDAFEQLETHVLVHKLLTGLSDPTLKTAVTMCYGIAPFERKYTQAEIAKHVGTSQMTVSRMLSKAYKQMRETADIQELLS